LALIDGAGHMVMLEREEAVARAVERFLRDQGLPG
jgi:pimeloyl-ACP methyl ester carboxylesterase